MAKSKTKSYSGWLTTQKIIRTTVCVLLCALSIFPFYIMIINSTRESYDIQKYMSLLPGSNFVANFKALGEYTGALGTPVWKSMLHSLVISGPATLLQIFVSTLTAYGIVSYRYKLKNFYGHLLWQL